MPLILCKNGIRWRVHINIHTLHDKFSFAICNTSKTAYLEVLAQLLEDHMVLTSVSKEDHMVLTSVSKEDHMVLTSVSKK